MSFNFFGFSLLDHLANFTFQFLMKINFVCTFMLTSLVLHIFLCLTLILLLKFSIFLPVFISDYHTGGHLYYSLLCLVDLITFVICFPFYFECVYRWELLPSVRIVWCLFSSLIFLCIFMLTWSNRFSRAQCLCETYLFKRTICIVGNGLYLIVHFFRMTNSFPFHWIEKCVLKLCSVELVNVWGSIYLLTFIDFLFNIVIEPFIFSCNFRIIESKVPRELPLKKILTNMIVALINQYSFLLIW